MSGFLKKIAAKLVANKAKISFTIFSLWSLWVLRNETETLKSFLFWTASILAVVVGMYLLIKREMRELAKEIEKKKDRLSNIAVGHTFTGVTDHIFDYWIYIPVIAALGPLAGGVTMAFASFVVCFIFLEFYDRMKIDWFGVELVKEVKDSGPEFIRKLKARSVLGSVLWWPYSKIILFVLWTMKKGGWLPYFALNILFDPFITTVYFRKEKFGGLNRRDWAIFLSSVVVANTYWTLRNYVLIKIFRFIFL